MNFFSVTFFLKKIYLHKINVLLSEIKHVHNFSLTVQEVVAETAVAEAKESELEADLPCHPDADILETE